METKLDTGALSALRNVAYDTQAEQGGSFLAADNRILESRAVSEMLEILPLETALEKYDWLAARLHTLVPADADDKTAQVAAEPKKLGYFIRVRENARITLPIQTCYLINQSDFTQLTHNVVIAEKGAELHLISGCTTNAHIKSGTHIGITEYFLEESAILTTTMIHSWGSDVEVYPRSAVAVGKNARFVSNYIALSPVKMLQMNPKASIEEGALGEFYSVVYAPAGSRFDIGSEAILRGKNAAANIISRSVSEGGEIIARGRITGEYPGGKGTMSCNGLMLTENGRIHAVPELVADDLDLELSHEASVGMISPESLAYLMASGISEEEAKSLIIEGFMDLRVPGLPDYLQRQIDELIRKSHTASAI